MTSNKNNAAIVRRNLLVQLCAALIEGDLEKIDRIPLEMKPKTKEAWRCCLYKDRAVLKYKLMALLGYSEGDELDELTTLAEYANDPKGHEKFILTLVTEACSNCPPSQYVVSNLCRACEARPCQGNCPKNAISFKNGKAEIDFDLCVNCGKCANECPYNAIHYIARPCEEVCPVGAVYQDKYGREVIDKTKCILCGKCMTACPFGAVMPSSVLPNMIADLKTGTQLVAIVAPSIAGQFRDDLSKIYGAMLTLGFTDVYSVAQGADLTAMQEYKELKQLMDDGVINPLLSSCCPAWVEYVHQSLRSHKQLVSNTPSPVAFTANIAKQDYPEAKIVFIAPCVAKKSEIRSLADCDYCIGFEELGAMFVAQRIEISNENDYVPKNAASINGHNFAKAGGVAQAIRSNMSEDCKIENLHGLNKSNIRQINQIIKNASVNFLEVMSCEEGCLGGCQSIVSPKEGIRIFNKKEKC